MRFYPQRHQYTCGVDLHARSMYLCILDPDGRTVLHRDRPAHGAAFLDAIEPFKEDLVVGVECMFAWYWLADLCHDNDIAFVLGHALYMKAIHGGKAKNDRIDADKLARLLYGGNFPLAYPYPAQMRATRDLMRRRNFFMRHRARLLAHIQNTCHQYNLPQFNQNLAYRSHRANVPEHFAGVDPAVRRMVELDLNMVDQLDEQLRGLELHLQRTAKIDNADEFYRLRSVPGIGQILALILLYEIHDIHRFESVGQFLSYCRLVRCRKESAGKTKGTGGNKFGNAHLKWAFSEATTLLMRESDQAKRFVERKARKSNKAKAMSMLSAKIGRAVYYMLKNQQAFDTNRFFAA